MELLGGNLMEKNIILISDPCTIPAPKVANLQSPVIYFVLKYYLYYHIRLDKW